MHDALLVSRSERIEHLIGDRQNFFHWQALSLAPPTLFERLAIEQLHDDERGAVFGNVVVVHRHRAAMTDRVGEVALTQETLADRGIGREFAVQHLHCRALLVAMCRRVHTRHTAHAKQAI